MNEILTFATPVDASEYIAGGDAASPGFGLASIVFEDPAHYRGRVQNADGTFSIQEVTINVDSPSVDLSIVAADIRAAIAATLS